MCTSASCTKLHILIRDTDSHFLNVTDEHNHLDGEGDNTKKIYEEEITIKETSRQKLSHLFHCLIVLYIWLCSFDIHDGYQTTTEGEAFIIFDQSVSRQETIIVR